MSTACADDGAAPALAVAGHVATITLRRPAQANRLTPQDLAALQSHLCAVDADAAVRVLVLRGQGRHFCSGFDLQQVGAQGADAGARFEALADAIERARPVTVAVLHGGTYGGAADLALACDFRLGCGATELRVPATALGLHFYRGGLERFVTRLGLPAARRILLAAERLDAVELQRVQYLDRLAADPQALAVLVDEFVGALAALAPLALLPMKRHLGAIARGALDADALARDIAAAGASADLQEGARAWSERRAPRFEGR